MFLFMLCVRNIYFLSGGKIIWHFLFTLFCPVISITQTLCALKCVLQTLVNIDKE